VVMHRTPSPLFFLRNKYKQRKTKTKKAKTKMQ
jgi:hypothetical protein